MSRWVIAAGLKLIAVPVDSTWMRRSLDSGSRARASHASRARAGRSRQRQSKWAGSTRRCTRTALVTAPFLFGTIPAAARSARLFPLGLPELSVPELTRSADIKLNDGLLLLRIRTALSSGRRAALAENTHHSPRGHDFNCSTGAAGFPQNRRPRLVIYCRTRIAGILDYLLGMLRKIADRRPSGFVEPCRPTKATRPAFRP